MTSLTGPTPEILFTRGKTEVEPADWAQKVSGPATSSWITGGHTRFIPPLTTMAITTRVLPGPPTVMAPWRTGRCMAALLIRMIQTLAIYWTSAIPTYGIPTAAGT